MKIAIPVSEPFLETMVETRFGRTKYFVVYDTESGDYKVVPNQIDLLSPVGAGIQAAQKVVEAQAQVVITGNCGPKAMKVLQTAGVKVVTGVEGLTVKEAIAGFEEGSLN